MTLTLIIISAVIISFLIVYRLVTEKKKYQDTAYLSNLQQIAAFFDTIERLDDYVTWVQRDQIKTRFAAVGQYFKNKSRSAFYNFTIFNIS
jgi:DNA helicase-4